jgi:hypothetical protein
VIQEVVVHRAVEDHDCDLLVGFESVDDFLELPDHFWAHDVERRVIERDAPIGGRPSRDANLSGLGQCACSCHVFSYLFVRLRNRLIAQRFLDSWIICSSPDRIWFAIHLLVFTCCPALPLLKASLRFGSRVDNPETNQEFQRICVGVPSVPLRIAY